MKVLYYHQHFSTPNGAAGIRSYQMAQALIKAGHQVSMVCGSYDVGQTGLTTEFKKGMRRGIVDDIEVIELELPYGNKDSFLKRIFIFIKFALRSCKLALNEKYDVILTTSTPLTVALPGIVAKKLRKKIFVFEVRDLWPELPIAMNIIRNGFVVFLLKKFEKMAYKNASHCIGLAPGIADGISKQLKLSNKVTMIPNGSDNQLFDSIPAQSNFINNFSLDPTRFYAAYTGTHGLANGLDKILDAAEVLLQRKNNNIILLFIGTGKLKSQLQERVKKENLTNCVFLNSMPKIDLVALIKSVNVGLMTLANIEAFYYGTSPNKFFDYLAAGIPVINNYPGWVADLIKKHQCGIAIEPDNPEKFADALEALANDKNLTENYGINARKLAESMFDREQLSEQFVTCIESVTS